MFAHLSKHCRRSCFEFLNETRWFTFPFRCHLVKFIFEKVNFISHSRSCFFKVLNVAEGVFKLFLRNKIPLRDAL